MSRSASPAPSTLRRELSRTPSNSSFYSDDQSVGSAYNILPNRRIEIMVKKEQQRQKDEAQFTYQPIIFTQRSPSSQRLRREQQIEGDQENRFDKLYGDAVKRQITEKIIQQVANDVAFDRDLTFSPRLSKKGANLSRSASRERLGISRSSFSSEAGSIASTARTSRSRSSSPARSEYSFSPQITKKAQLSADRRSLSAERFFSDEPSASRLYRQAAVLEEKAAQRKEEMEQLSMQECTFTPRLATSRAAVTQKVHEELQHGNGLDVSERLMRREHLRKIKLEQAKLEQDAKQREQLTFKPHIKGVKSRSASPARPADVVERLLTPTRKSRNAIIAEAEANVQLTFHPKIPSRRSASPNTVREQVYSSVHEKLFVEGVHHQREKDTESERQRAELPAEYTFRPRLRSRSGTPTSPSPSPFDGHDDYSSVGPSSTAVDALFARLAYQDKANPVRRQKLEDEVARRMPFRPTIGERSRELQAQRNCSTPIYQRLKDKADKCAAELAARRALVAQQRAEEDARSMRPPQLSIRSLELVALHHRRSQSASPSPQRRVSSSSTTPRSPGIDVGDEEKDGNDAVDGVEVCDESGALYDDEAAELEEEEEDTTSSVFSRLSEQHTSSSARRRSLAAREHLLGRDDPQSFRLSMDDDDGVDGNGDGDGGVDHHKHFVRASAKRTLSGRDLHHMVQRLAVPYPREQRQQQQRPVEEPPEHRSRPRLPAAVLDAAATRLNQKTTQAFRLATDERLRQEAQDKAMSENDVYARFTPRKMTEAQRGALFQRLAAGERRSDDVHDDNDDEDVRRVIPSSTSSSSYGVHKRNALSPSPSTSRRRSSSCGSSSNGAQLPATSKATRSLSTTPLSTSRRNTPRSHREEEEEDNGSDAGSVSTVGSVHSVKSNASFRSWQSHSSTSKAKPTTTTTPTRTTTTTSAITSTTTKTTTTSSTRKSTASSTSTATTPRASPSIRAGVKTVGSSVVTNNNNSNNNSRSATPTQQRGMSPRASNGNGNGNDNSHSHNSSNNRNLSSHTPKVIIPRSTIDGGGRSASSSSSSSSMQPVHVDDAASEAVVIASSPTAAAESNSLDSHATETDTAPPESTELLIAPTESSTMTTTMAAAEAIVRSPPSAIQSPTKAAGGNGGKGNGGSFPSHGSTEQNVHQSPTPSISTSTSTSSRPSFSSSAAAADRLVHVHVPPSPALGGRKPSNSRIPMPSSAAPPSHAPKVQYEWAGSKQNTSKKPSDDFEAKLQASLAMLKPLDDLLASPIIGHSSTTKHMAPDK